MADVMVKRAYLDILIIGTWFKQDGDVRKPVDPKRVAAMVDKMRRS
jgi:predicted TIM-barrel enzyme